MKNLFLAVFAVGIIVILVYGNNGWQKKTTIKVEGEVKTSNTTTENDGSLKDYEIDDFVRLTNSWPVEASESYKNALSNGVPFNIVFVGSHALGVETNGWSTIVRGNLEVKYDKTVGVELLSYDLTSAQFVEENKVEEVIAANPDFVILEPFTLKDNGIVTIEDSLQNIESVIYHLKEHNPEVVIALQPPHPLYNSRHYPIQVSELQKYAEANNLFYINHWEAWPEQTSEELIEYLLEDRSAPNEKGHQVWADYLLNILVTK